MALKRKKPRPEKLRPHIESPTWGHLHRMTEAEMEVLGGPAREAKVLSSKSFYAERGASQPTSHYSPARA